MICRTRIIPYLIGIFVLPLCAVAVAKKEAVSGVASLDIIAKTPDECVGLANLPVYTGDANNTPNYPSRVISTHAPIELVSWNIHKEKDTALPDDLRRLVERADLILLQEAYSYTAQHAVNRYAYFAPGYESRKGVSGVMTVAHVKSNLECHFTHTEPLLRTPKASLITRFTLDNQQQLLVINLHGINFTLGKDAFSMQMDAVFKVAAAHSGPIVLAGDFNTWGEWREKYVLGRAEALKLRDSMFMKDIRSKVFGGVLDRVMVRDISVVHSEVIPYTTSDHYPLYLKLEVTKPLNISE